MTKKYLNLAKTVVITALLTISASYIYADWSGPPGVPTACPDSTPGCNVPINEGVVAQVKRAGLGLWGRFYTKDKASIGLDDPTTMTSSLKLQVNGKVGADAYCDQAGNNCIIPPGGADGGLWRAVPNTQMIENANNGKVRINGKIIIAGGKPAAGKVLAAQDDTGVARWRYVSELIPPSTQVASCPSGQAIQSINADGNPTCVNLTTKTTSSGSGFLLSLIPQIVLGGATSGSDADGGGSCRVVNGGSCGTGSFDNRTCLQTSPANASGGVQCVKSLCCSY